VWQEKVEIVRRSLDAHNAGDIDAALAYYSPDVEVFPDASVYPEPGPLHGRTEYRRFIEDIASPWVNPQYVVREVFAVGGDRVVYRGDWRGEGVASGVETASSVTGVYTRSPGRPHRCLTRGDPDMSYSTSGSQNSAIFEIVTCGSRTPWLARATSSW